MSKNVDDRVVEMRFDNKNFESNVKTSMDTLDKLKKSLKLEDAAKGFNEINKASKNISFDKISSSVSTLEKRFSTMGIVGMRVIENLTDSAMNLIKKTSGFFMDGIISGGKRRAMNLENAHFMLQGLLKDEKAVADVMQNVNDSVDGTAYSLDSAAKVASQFAATGMRAGDQMFRSLRGVAGVAAMTNSEYDEIGRIFTTVAGNGRLMGDQLLQLASRGLNAAATLSEYLGITEAEVREMTSKGQIDFQTFADAMDNAFGEHAKKANETFTGALSNIGAALARIGALFISPLVEQNGALVQLFNAIRVKINDIKNSLVPVADVFVKVVNKTANTLTYFISNMNKLSGKNLIIESIKNAFSGLATIALSIKNAFSEMITPFSTDIFTTIVKKINNFSKKLLVSEESADKLKRTFKGLFSVLDLIRSVMSSGFKIAYSALSTILGTFNIDLLDLTAYIGDHLTKIRDWIKEQDLLKKTLDAIIPVIKKIVEIFKEYIVNNEKIQNGIKNLNNLLKNSINSISEWLDGFKEADNIPQYIISGFVNGIKKGSSLVINAMINLGHEIINAIKNVLGIHSPSTEFFIIGQNTIQGFINGLKNGTSNLLSYLRGIGSAIIEVFSQIDFGKILSVGMIGGILYVINNVVNLLKDFATPFKGIGHMTDSIGGFFDTLSEKFKPSKIDGISQVILKLAISIGILAASIYVLYKMDTGKLWATIGAIAALMTLLVGFSALSSYLDKMIGPEGNFTKMAISIGILVGVVYLMSKLNLDEIKKGIECLVVFGIFITTLIAATSLAGKNINGLEKTIIGISLSMFLLIGVIKLVSGLEAGEIIKGIACIWLFGSFIAALIVVTKLAGKNIDGLGRTILGISLSMLLLIGVIKLSYGLKEEEIKKGIKSISLFGGIIAGLIAITRIAGGGDFKGVATTIIAMSVAIGIMAGICILLGMIDTNSLVKGITAVGLLSILLGAMIYATKGANDCKGNIIAMTVAIGIMVASIVALSFIDTNKLLTSTLALVSVMSAFAFMLKSASGFKTSLQSIGGILLLTVVVAALGTVLGLMSKFNVKGSIQTALSISILLLAMSGALKVLGSIKTVDKSVINSMLLLTAVVAGLGLILGLMSKFNVEGSIQTALSISILLLAMSGALKVLGSIESVNNSVMASMLLLTAVVAGLGLILGLMSKFNVEGSIQTALSISILLLAMSGALKVLSTIGKINMSVIGAMALLGLVVAELGLILGLMSKFDIEPSIETAKALSILLTAMSGSLLILGVVGKLGSGAFIGIGALATLITAVGGLMVGIGALVEHIPAMEKWLDTGIVVLSKIGTGLGSFFGSIVSGFLGSMSDALPKIAENLSLFGIGLVPFFMSIKMLNPDSANAVKALAETILILTGAEFLKGITSWITGKKSFADFGLQLVAFGLAIKEYGDVVKDINTDGVEKSVIAGKALAELAKALPNEGGLVGSIFGNNDIGTFGENIKTFAGCIKEYGDVVKDINTDGVEKSVIAGKALAELAKALPNEGGLVGSIFGNNDIGTFGKNIKTFADSLVDYCDIVSNLNVSGVSDSVAAGTYLAELANVLTNSGVKNIDKFGDNLPDLAESIVSFANKMSEADIIGVSEKIKAFSLALYTLGKSGVSKFTDAIKKGADEAKALGQKIISSFLDGALGQQIILVAGFKLLVTSIMATIQGYYSSFKSIGSYLVSGFARGISDSSHIAVLKAKAMAKAAYIAANKELAVNSPSKVFIKIGKSVGEGFSKGISDKANMSNVIKASSSMAEGVIRSAKNTLEVHSPSRVFIALGKLVGEGLAKGIYNSAMASVNAITEVSQKIQNVAKKSFEEVENWLSDAEFYDEISLDERIALWDLMAKKYADGTEEQEKANQNLYSALKEKYNNDYDEFKSKLDDKVTYSQITTQELLDEWKKQQPLYKEGTAERKEIDKNIYDFENRLRSEWLEEEKNYNRLSLEDELRYWQKEAEMYREGTEKRKEADKNIYDLKHQIIDGNIMLLEQELWKQTKIRDALSKNTEGYRKASKEVENLQNLLDEAKWENSKAWIEEEEYYGRLSSLGGRYAAALRMQKKYQNLLNKDKEKEKELNREIYSLEKEIHDKFVDYKKEEERIEKERSDNRKALEEKYAKDQEEINKKLAEDRQKLNDEYDNEVKSRTKSLYDSYKLFDKVDKKEKVNGLQLITNLKDQIAEFDRWEKNIKDLSKKVDNTEFIKELQEMGVASVEEIEALNKLGEPELTDYVQLWADKHRQANEMAIFELTDLREKTDSEITSLEEKAKVDLQALESDFNTSLKNINDDADAQLSELLDTFNSNFKNLRVETVEEFYALREEIKRLCDPREFEEIGKYTIQGFSKGMVDNMRLVYNATTGTYRGVIDGVDGGLEIDSPSKVMFRRGRWVVEGFVNGIDSLKNKVSNSTDILKNKVVSGFASAIDIIQNAGNSNLDIYPEIKPIANLSDIDRVNSAISGLLTGRSLGVDLGVNSTNNYIFDSISKELKGTTDSLNDRISEEVGGLRDDISTLSEAIKNIKIVMDTGTLVGAITPSMDKSLGKISIYNKRGI